MHSFKLYFKYHNKTCIHSIVKDIQFCAECCVYETTIIIVTSEMGYENQTWTKSLSKRTKCIKANTYWTCTYWLQLLLQRTAWFRYSKKHLSLWQTEKCQQSDIWTTRQIILSILILYRQHTLAIKRLGQPVIKCRFGVICGFDCDQNLLQWTWREV